MDADSRDLHLEVPLTLEQAANGAEVAVELPKGVRCGACASLASTPRKACPACAGSGASLAPATIQIRVPAGVDTGTTLRLPGAGFPGDPPGIVHLRIAVRPHPDFVRNDLDLTGQLRLSARQANAGAAVIMPVLGRKVSITVPAGTADGTRLVVPDGGIVSLDRSRRGSLTVVARIDPKKRWLFW